MKIRLLPKSGNTVHGMPKNMDMILTEYAKRLVNVKSNRSVKWLFAVLAYCSPKRAVDKVDVTILRLCPHHCPGKYGKYHEKYGEIYGEILDIHIKIMPQGVPPILARLGLEPARWIDTVQHFRRHFFDFVGPARALEQRGQATGRRWLRDIAASRRLFGGGQISTAATAY